MRVAILGGPRVGKTTFATKLAKKHGLLLHSTGKRSPDSLVHTDSCIGVGWDNVPAHLISKLSAQESFILEGTQAARVLRRWFKDDPDGPRLDCVYIFSIPRVARTGGQTAMARGVRTIIDGLLPTLHRAKVKIVMNPEDVSQ